MRPHSIEALNSLISKLNKRRTTMANSNLLKEAIADAKAVRETALANAKIALEEAFTPRIQSMLSAKLAEEEEMEEAAEEPVEKNGDGMDAAAGSEVSEGEHGDDEMKEGMHGDEEKNEGMHGDEEKNEGMHGDEEVSETEDNMEEDMEDKVEETEDMEEDLELEAIIKELEEELDSSDIGDGENKEPAPDASDDHTEDPGEGDLTVEGEGEEKKMDEEKDDMDEDISLDEIISALREEEEDKVEEGEDKEEKNEEAEKELEEAYNVIKFLRSKINEVNLLNAKLLFSNKLFRNHSMNENQKMKVIENFDRAQSLREVKLVFATLSESFNLSTSKTKRTIKESYASKSTASTAPSKKVISEGSDLSARWKKLANL